MTRPTVVVMPGASLMDVRLVPDGVKVSCPGCGATQIFPAGVDGGAAFAHEDGCPVHARIQAAIARYARAVVRYG